MLSDTVFFRKTAWYPRCVIPPRWLSLVRVTDCSLPSGASDWRISPSACAEKYEFAFWAELARTAALLVAMVVALPFGFGSMRSAGGGARTTVGLGVGIVYFFLQRTVESGTVVFQLDPIVIAWLPTAILALIAGYLMTRIR